MNGKPPFWAKKFKPTFKNMLTKTLLKQTTWIIKTNFKKI